jgi:hypothetical protein
LRESLALVLAPSTLRFRARWDPQWCLNRETNDMLSFRTTLVAAAMTLSVAAPAFAQNISMELSDRQAMMITSSGKVMRMDVGGRGHQMMMKYGHPVKAGTIFYMSGGRLYMTSDRPMSGRMLADQLGN